MAAGLGSQRLLELDVIRASAIILIFLFHVPYNLGIAAYGQPWGPQSSLYIFQELLFYVKAVGLSLFFFISGYAIDLRNSSITSSDEVKNFLVKRAKRIYPLYWLALIVGLIVGLFTNNTVYGWPVNLNPSVYVTNFLGLQALLAPQFLDENLIVIWFVGVILLYYLCYPGIVRRSSNRTKVLINASVIFLFFCVLNVVFHMVEYRFFLYYFVFVAGVVAQRSDFLHTETNKVFCLSAIFVLCILAIIYHMLGAVVAIALQLSFSSVYDLNFAINLIFFDVTMLLFMFIIASIVKSQSKRIGNRAHKYIYIISYAAYAIFLFHVPFIALCGQVFGLVGLGQLESALIVIILGFPLITLFSFYLQQYADKFLAYLTTHFSAH
jgi:peptidoglycan/LPS O-acetylase OafA/YrhL